MTLTLTWRNQILGAAPIVGSFEPGADVTTALGSMLADAGAAGGGTIIVAGEARLSDRVVVGPGCALWGAGPAATTFRAAHADAEIAFGTELDSCQQGGLSGNFTFDGAGIATRSVFWGLGANRAYGCIRVRNCQTGMAIEATQNSAWWSMFAGSCGSGLLIDAGAKNLAWHGVLNDCDRSLIVQQSKPHPTNPTGNSRPTSVHFTGGPFESQVGGPNVTISAGRDISFTGMSMTAADGQPNVFLTRQSSEPGAHITSRIRFTQCELARGAVALDIVGATGGSALVDVELDTDTTLVASTVAAIRSDPQGGVRRHPSVTANPASGGSRFVGVDGAVEDQVVSSVAESAGWV